MPEAKNTSLFSGKTTAKIESAKSVGYTQRKRKKQVISRKSPEETRNEILSGRTFDAPLERSKVVRIFLSSTFHDFIDERNYLFKNALPAIESWCREKGIEFQVADMRWGIRDSATVEHGGGSMCLQEVKHCRKLSIGPNFVALIGNRYGRRPLPTVIGADDFEILTQHMSGIEQSLMNEWYQKNENCIPFEYLLRPIDSIYPNYMNRDSADLRLKDRNKWAESESQLRKVIDKSVKEAVKEHKLENVHQYIASITEQEIWEGVVNSDDPERSAICFMRHFNALDPEKIKSKKAKKYIDFDQSGKRDETCKEMLETLTNFQLPMNLDDQNIIRYNVDFDVNSGINQTDPKHAQYLRELNSVFENKIKDMISNALKDSKNVDDINDKVYNEVMQHSQFAVAKAQLFCGRDSTLDWLYGKLSNTENRQPLILYGESGVGKTATVAKVILEATKCIPNQPNVIYRFLGTTPYSSSIDSLFRSLCAQVCALYEIKRPSKEQESDFNVLKPYFYHVLSQVGESKSKPALVVILDSMDKLSPAFGAHLTSWLPGTLPNRVTFMLSVMPGYQQILTRLQSRFSPQQFLELTQQRNEAGSAVLRRLLQKANHVLQEEQMNIVEEVIDKSQTPLVLHLTVIEAIQWKSFTPQEEIKLGNSAREAVHVLFDRLETQHGKMLISHALAYLVAANLVYLILRNGLTEQEMEEVLSLDNDVLDDVYQYWAPPATDELRVPPLVWARLKQDMAEFIMNRSADDAVVMSLYHKQFTEVVMQRYLKGDTKNKIHKNLADFFQGTWAKRPKPAHLGVLNKEKRFLWRKVRSQPYKFGNERYNLRKLNELPYHLTRCEDADETIDREVFLNYEYLSHKLDACGMAALLNDFDAYQMTGAVPEYSCIRQALRLSKPTMEFSYNEDILATELIGRMKLLGEKYAGISSLLEQAKSACDQMKDKTLLVPLNQCFMAPNGVLIATLFGHKAGLTSLASSDLATTVVTASKDRTVRISDLKTDVVLHDISLKTIPEVVVLDDLRDRIYIGDSQGAIHVYEAKTGSQLAHLTSGDIDNNEDVIHETLHFPDMNLDFDVHPRRPFTGFSSITDNGIMVMARDNQITLMNVREKAFPLMRLNADAKITFVQESENTLLVGFGKNSLIEMVPKHRSHKLLAFAEGAQLIGASYTSGKKHLLAVANQAPKGGACLLQVGSSGESNEPLHLLQTSSTMCDFLCEVHRTTVVVAGAARIKVLEMESERPMTSASHRVATAASTRSNVSCKSIFSALLPANEIIDHKSTTENSGGDLEMKMTRTICSIKLMPRQTAHEKLLSPLLLVGCEDETIRVYDLELRTLRTLLSGVWGPPDLILCSAKGVIFTASTMAPNIKVWDLESQINGEEVEESDRSALHAVDDSSPVIVQNFVVKPVFIPNPRSVFTSASLGGEPNCISLGDSRGVTQQIILEQEVRGLIHIFDNGRRLLYGNNQGKIHWYNLEPNELKPRNITSSSSSLRLGKKNQGKEEEKDVVVGELPSPIHKYSYHATFESFAVLLENQQVFIVKLDGSSVTVTKQGIPKYGSSQIVDLCFTDEGLILVYHSDNAILVNLGSKGKTVLKFHFQGQFCEAMCTRNQFFCVCIRDTYTMDKTIQIWNLDENKVKRTIQLHKFEVSCMELSIDCATLFVGAGRVEYSLDVNKDQYIHSMQQRQIRIYCVEDGSMLRSKVGMYSPVKCMQSFPGDILGVVLELGYIGFFKIQIGTMRFNDSDSLVTSSESVNSLKIKSKSSAKSSKTCILL